MTREDFVDDLALVAARVVVPDDRVAPYVNSQAGPQEWTTIDTRGSGLVVVTVVASGTGNVYVRPTNDPAGQHVTSAPGESMILVKSGAGGIEWKSDSGTTTTILPGLRSIEVRT